VVNLAAVVVCVCVYIYMYIHTFIHPLTFSYDVFVVVPLSFVDMTPSIIDQHIDDNNNIFITVHFVLLPLKKCSSSKYHP
jgi:hypothetical protein